MDAQFNPDEWPSQGRIGQVESGEFKGMYVFVWPEIDGRWGFYTSEGGDDILPGAAMVETWIPDGSIRWLEPQDDDRIERQIFRMRPIVSSQFDPGPSIWAHAARWFALPTRTRTRTSVNEAIRAWEERLTDRGR